MLFLQENLFYFLDPILTNSYSFQALFPNQLCLVGFTHEYYGSIHTLFGGHTYL